MDGRRIEHKRLGWLLEQVDERNPKTHDLDLVTQSIGRFGFVEPVVLDQRTGRLVSGHGRVAALAAMHDSGQAPPDGVQEMASPDIGDGTVDDWYVPVVMGWSSRSDAEAGAALVALNRTTERGGWDETALLDLLDQLGDEADALLGVGYDDDELAGLRARLEVLDGTFEVPDRSDEVTGSRPVDVESLIDPAVSTTCPSCGFEWETGPAQG